MLQCILKRKSFRNWQITAHALYCIERNLRVYFCRDRNINRSSYVRKYSAYFMLHNSQLSNLCDWCLRLKGVLYCVLRAVETILSTTHCARTEPIVILKRMYDTPRRRQLYTSAQRAAYWRWTYWKKHWLLTMKEDGDKHSETGEHSQYNAADDGDSQTCGTDRKHVGTTRNKSSHGYNSLQLSFHR